MSNLSPKNSILTEIRARSKGSLIDVTPSWEMVDTPPTMEYPVDMLVRSCAARDTASPSTLAREIMKHYSQKLMFLALKGVTFSNFRKDLNTFVNVDAQVLREKFAAMAFRLPEMYQSDLQFDQLRTGLRTSIDIDTRTRIEHHIRKPTKLFPLGQINNTSRGTKSIHYWMKNEEDLLFNISLQAANPLLHLWDTEFSQSVLTISGNPFVRTRDDIDFVVFRNWNLS